MMQTKTERQGFALATALLAMVLVGAIVTGGFYAASQEHEVSESTRYGAAAFRAAEHGIQTALGDWKSDYNDLADGESKTFRDTLATDGPRADYAAVEIHRFNKWVFYIDSEGRVSVHGDRVATRRTGALVRLTPIEIEAHGAVAARGNVEIKGNAEIHGEDDSPSSWNQCPPDSAVNDKPGVAVPPDYTVTQSGNASEITGDPKIKKDTTLNNSQSLLTYGDYTYQELAAMADKTIPAGEYSTIQPSFMNNGSCDTADPVNWGDPTHDGTTTCEDYYPIVHVEGGGNSELHISGGGEGQGILLVDGDLKISGSFVFNGVVVVRGKLTVTGTGGDSKLTGVVLVNSGYIDKNASSTDTSGNSVIQYSSCVVETVTKNNSNARPINKRSWMDLSAAIAEDA